MNLLSAYLSIRDHFVSLITPIEPKDWKMLAAKVAKAGLQTFPLTLE